MSDIEKICKAFDEVGIEYTRSKNMDIKDLQIETYTNASPRVTMRITHLPTGLSVVGDNQGYLGQYRLKEKLLRELKHQIQQKK